MPFTIDIDTGGTFTDGFVRGDGRTVLVKVDTTPHDLTVCFLNCIEEAARSLGLPSAEHLLAQTSTLRLSTTIGTNALLQRSGPKLGLLVTRGAGENGYAPEGVANPAIGFLISQEMIATIDEELGESGASLRPPAGAEVLVAVKGLLDRGARRIVVSLARSPLNPAHEQACRELVLEDYPAHYLGTVPLLLSTEVSSQLDDRCRTNAALIDAYIHQAMAHYLYKADEDVRRRRYRWPLLVVHANGGARRVAKTKAIDTLDSGPAAGLLGAAHLARLYGLKDVLTVDVGGTSSDLGFIARGEPYFTDYKEVHGVPVRERVIETESIGGGGSSIAWIDAATGALRVGPQSAGALPGPACYGLGGDRPTVTDAWVTLGYIDPEYFLGGRRRLDAARARAVIEKQIAGPLALSVEEAAEAIVREVTLRTAESVREFLAARGAEAEGVTMFAFGGAGGLSCGGVARAAGIGKVYFFPFGAHFCAFGSSCADVVHTYSAAADLQLAPDAADAVRGFDAAVAALADDAYFDMLGEGFEREKVTLSLEVVAASPQATEAVVVPWLQLTLGGEAGVRALLEEYRRRAGLKRAPAAVAVRELRLRAAGPIADPQLPKDEPHGKDPAAARKGVRPVYWRGKLLEAPLYDQERLRCGNVVQGLALVESPHTTILVPPGYRYTVDEHLNAVMEEA